MHNFVTILDKCHSNPYRSDAMAKIFLPTVGCFRLFSDECNNDDFYVIFTVGVCGIAPSTAIQ